MKSTEKKLAYNREWFKRNPHKRREYNRRRYKRNPAKEWLRNIKRRYGVTPEQYKQMIEQQDNKCAICGGQEATRLSIDHNHRTKVVRGLLCRPCNRDLHRVEDPQWLIKALLYLDRGVGAVE